MLIGEAAKKTRLTKKAVEYYDECGLINPEISENGYRVFSDEDMKRLKKISVLRNLGLSAAEIKVFLAGESGAEIQRIAEKKSLEAEAIKERERLLKRLISEGDWEKTSEETEKLKKKYSVLTRLLNCFPGFLGRYLIVHFAPFLNDPVTTTEQQEAFDTIVFFLDNLTIDIPHELREFLSEITKEADDSLTERMSENLRKTAENPQKYLEENRESIELYMKFKETQEYKNSPAFRLNEFFRKISCENGYYDIFIPAVKTLSPSYREYCEKLSQADRIFAEKFGE